MRKIIVIPSYEPDNKLLDVINSIDKEYDIIVVNDGSDNSFDNIFNDIPKRVKLLSYDTNRGKGYALKYAFKYIRDNYNGDYIVITMDSDGQHKIEDAVKLGNYVMNNMDTLVLGKRLRGKNTPVRSRIGNGITRFVYRITTGLNVYDTQTGLRAFSNKLMDKIIDINGDRFEYEMNVLLEFARDKVNIHELEIETIYIDNNNASHFDVVSDSYKIYKEILKFSLSSIISFIIDYILYSLFIILFNNISISNLTARFISASVNYNINKRVVFDSDSNYSLVRYIILALVIIVLNTFILNVFVYKLFINKYIAKIMVELLLFIVSFLVQRMIIFKK